MVSLEERVRNMGYPPHVAEMVTRSVRDAGTERDVLDGKCVLPHPLDAQAHYDRTEAENVREKIHAADADTVASLQQRIAALEEALTARPEAKEGT